VFDDAKYQWLKRLNVRSIPECGDCFAQYSCKGDCPANKAVVSPQTFWSGRSYRCKAIREFTKKVLSYTLEHDDGGLLF